MSLSLFCHFVSPSNISSHRSQCLCHSSVTLLVHLTYLLTALSVHLTIYVSSHRSQCLCHSSVTLLVHLTVTLSLCSPSNISSHRSQCLCHSSVTLLVHLTYLLTAIFSPLSVPLCHSSVTLLVHLTSVTLLSLFSPLSVPLSLFCHFVSPSNVSSHRFP